MILHFDRCRTAREPLWTNWLTMSDGRAFGTKVEKVAPDRYEVQVGQQVAGCSLLDSRASGGARCLDEAFALAGELIDDVLAADARR